MSKPNKDVKQTTNKADSEITKVSDKDNQSIVSEQKNMNKKEESGQHTQTEKAVPSNNKNPNKKKQKPNVASQSSVNTQKKTDEKTVEPTKAKPQAEPKEKKQKSGGTGIALLALLVSLGVGGAGYYFGMQKFTQLEQKIATFSQQSPQVNTATATAGVSSEQLNQQLAQLTTKLEEQVKTEVQTQIQPVTQDIAKIQDLVKTKAVVGETELNTSTQTNDEVVKLVKEYKTSQQKIAQLEKMQSDYAQQIAQLKIQVNTPESTAVVLSDADFLLNNALRKMVLDNDIGTAKLLLKDTASLLSDVSDPQASKIKAAIQTDLKQLDSVNEVDQDALMLKLTHLANSVDDMPMLNSQEDGTEETSKEISGSLEDWQKNIEKSAGSFLSHFIRINDKDNSIQKVFVSPSQEAYLRENIRLRLQIATLAIPRQQNTLYKESLDTVASWVRSYFDVESSNVKAFLNEIDSLAQQSVYIDAPQQLSSLDLLNTLRTQEVPKAPQPQEVAQ
ncbi:uroporphyrinogen-III C-methyltransferase [Pasteurella atlantica]|uniref:uroporphyrinogen-III C-methyltransferase n=1 Tax=Pasteurellaceae TaxID=712 RepID=UPI0027461226|nr:uroporphyrinogen-III C-methyltransferase [Pasteurella atlantica]MDP8033215.1 uroporphyrinogen-III C-methyltransferase [Pasteurella atlantica]MDP8035235.1 uroporphyrinogen-III C-methyltransferase [Pasteurella atlantica]MDP8037185.1 uroporphyrinogen-III C-methyltransferase [Pasteurella atlantica]MDP8047372.1 uroporphyrinogen-III C-methyltransferase [Pasteurella atlantica]MDP8049404.1 uroporphyrinogen-III C-methyltransferase [Pasteurella atlantica]